MSRSRFSGSYDPDDVEFLLKVIDLPDTPLEERERLIQSGGAHYSEMIGREAPPSERYMEVFRDACRRNAPLMARLSAELAALVAASLEGAITLVSMARAGTPVGAVLVRMLRRYFGREARHYSISIIRDRGIDENALDHILRVDARPAASLVFVDGWTGKGVIARELETAVARYNAASGFRLSPALHTLTDLSGTAGVSPAEDDFLIPSSVLNCVVSGLVSRTILNRRYIGPDDFHGCLYYRELAAHDVSRRFVDLIMEEAETLDRRSPLARIEARAVSAARRRELRRASRDFIEKISMEHGVRDVNRIKPGIGEATRVLLRRCPDLLLLKEPGDENVRHLRFLAEAKGVPVCPSPDMPYRAAAVIKDVMHA